MGNKRCALIVGGSRGIGAASARLFADTDVDLVMTYHTRRTRAENVAKELRSAGKHITVAQFDLASDNSARALAETLHENGIALDTIVLCAAGGMERNQPEGYAWNLNALGPSSLISHLVPMCNVGCNYVLVTSHEAHLYGQKAPYGDYVEIARAKKAGEQRLLADREKLIRHGINLIIVSADIVEDSPTAKLLELRNRGLLASRRNILGKLPKSEDVASEVFRVSQAKNPQFGEVHFVWEPTGYLE